MQSSNRLSINMLSCIDFLMGFKWSLVQIQSPRYSNPPKNNTLQTFILHSLKSGFCQIYRFFTYEWRTISGQTGSYSCFCIAVMLFCMAAFFVCSGKSLVSLAAFAICGCRLFLWSQKMPMNPKDYLDNCKNIPIQFNRKDESCLKSKSLQ